MRKRTGCQACRDRHIKCVKQPDAKKCEKCLETDRECLQTSLHRFRPVKSVPLKNRDGKAVSKQNLTFDSFQVWVDVPNKVDFGSSHNGRRLSEESEMESARSMSHLTRRKSSLITTGIRDDTLIDYPQAIVWDSPMYDASSIFSSEQVQSVQRAQSAEPARDIHSSNSMQAIVNIADHLMASPQRMRIVDEAKATAMSPPTNIVSPTQYPPRQKQASYSSHVSPLAYGPSPGQSSMRPGILSANSITTSSPALSMTPSWPFQNSREAKLFYHYVKNISPWIDVCDPNGLFGREIPRRVAHHPIISSAIFALASRHLSLLSDAEKDDSPRYVDECLQILINILEDPLGHSDENLLAAVILLRSHEELADHDERCHALGTTRLLNSIAAGAGDGGLRESASWISLRQHIYISLTGQESLSLNLDNYRHSSTFTDQTDEAWANRIIFIFANILNYVFNAESTEDPQLDPVRYSEFEVEVESWNTTKPWYFSALWADETDHKGPYGWPELLTSHPCHAVGLQYYHLCKIVLAIYDPKLSKLGFSSYRLRKNSELIVVENLRMALGLAVSNPDVTNAMFQGSHILTACGSFLHDLNDQKAAIDFLTGMRTRMGWNTSRIIRSLQEQWQS